MPSPLYTPSFNAAMNQRAFDGLTKEMQEVAKGDPKMMLSLELEDLRSKQAMQALVMQTLSAMAKKMDDVLAAIAQNFR
jgi:hypothetical protein